MTGEHTPAGLLMPVKLIWKDISVLALKFSPNEEMRVLKHLDNFLTVKL